MWGDLLGRCLSMWSKVCKKHSTKPSSNRPSLRARVKDDGVYLYVVTLGHSLIRNKEVELLSAASPNKVTSYGSAAASPTAGGWVDAATRSI
jgi:hypothetical protein